MKEKKRIVAALIFLVATFLVVGLLSKYAPYLENLELKNYDFLMAVLRGPGTPPPNIAVVALDDASVDEFGPLPWPRGYYGELIYALNDAGARAIVFDVAFIGESGAPEQDEALATAIEFSEVPIVLAAAIEVVDDPRFSMIRQLLPLEKLIDAGGVVGFATLNPDRDGVLRNGRLFVGGQPTLSTGALEVLDLEPDYSSLPYSGYEGDDPELLINYCGGSRTVPTYSFYQAIDHNLYLPEGVFEDKIVFVGFSLAVTAISEEVPPDHYPSPFDGLTGRATMAGVEIHANLLDTILRERYIVPFGKTNTWVLLISLALAISLVVLLIDSFVLKIAASLALVLAFFGTSVFLFLAFDYTMLTVQPLVIMISLFGLNVLYQYRLTEKERAHIRKALSGYVSRQVMNEIMKNPDQLELGGTQVEATVLFSDIAGFSKISEKTTPRELASLLNDYFTRMGDEIMSRDGMINKYIGDAIMAIWNAPLPNEEHAILACRSALRMKTIVGEMPPLQMRIGVNTGTMVAGNLGHRERMEYTVIGDSVNLASRLEGANKAFGTSILISEATRDLAGDSLLARRIDRIRVVGKEEPVAVFEVLGDEELGIEEETRELVASFQQILEAYDERRWDLCLERIEAHLERYPEDGAAKTYRLRCQAFQEDPPAPEWDGVFDLKSK